MNIRRLCNLALMPALAALASAASAAGAAVEPLEIDDAVLMARFLPFMPPAQPSPDGRWIAATVCDMKRSVAAKQDAAALNPYLHGCDVWLYSGDGRRARNLTAAKGNSWLGGWTRDGRELVFHSDRDGEVRLWRWRPEGDAIERIAEASLSPFAVAPMQWASQDEIVVQLKPDTPAAEAAPGNDPRPAGQGGSTVTVFHSPGPADAGNASRGQAAELAAVNVGTGQVRPLASLRQMKTWRLSPDGRRLAYVRYRDRAGDRAVDDAKVRADQQELYWLDLASGKSTRVGLISDGIDPSWSPDGTRLAYANVANDVPRNGDALPDVISQRFDALWVADLGTGAAPVRIALPQPNAVNGELAWAPDGSQVFLLGIGQLWTADVRAGQVRKLSSSPYEWRSVLRDIGGRTRLTPDGHALWLHGHRRDSRADAFCQVRLADGRVHCPLEEDRRFGGVDNAPVFSADGRRLLYVAEAGNQPPDLWEFDPASGRSRRLTSINPRLSERRFGGTRLIEFVHHDGQRLRASLLLPPDYRPGQRYPTVVWVYASDFGSRRVNAFGLQLPQYNMQMLATRGYAVLWPDIPVRIGSPMQDLMKAVMPAIDQAIADGYVDPDRLAVMGQSNGGYSTLSLLVQSDRFKAGIMNAGFGDLTGFHGHAIDGRLRWEPWLEANGGAMGAPPWEAPLRYISNSPIYYLDRIDTPLMIQAGTEDLSIVPFSEQVFGELRRLGKEAVFLRYKGEGHVLNDAANLRDWWARMLEFLDKHVKHAGDAGAQRN